MGIYECIILFLVLLLNLNTILWRFKWCSNMYYQYRNVTLSRPNLRTLFLRHPNEIVGL